MTGFESFEHEVEDERDSISRYALVAALYPLIGAALDASQPPTKLPERILTFVRAAGELACLLWIREEQRVGRELWTECNEEALTKAFLDGWETPWTSGEWTRQ